jgi:hypothetical protein
VIAILLYSAVAACMLALLLARYGRSRAARPPPEGASLRALTVELLEKMGLTIVSAADDCLVAVREELFGQTRYVVVIGDVALVDQAAVLAAAETVRAERGARGMLVTAGEIRTEGLAGLDLPLEVVDGARLRQLLAQPQSADRPGQLEIDRWVSEGGARR